MKQVNQDVETNYLNELQRLSKESSYSYLKNIDLENEFVTLKETEDKIKENNLENLKIQELILQLIQRELKNFSIQDLNIFYNLYLSRIIIINLKLNNQEKEYLIYKENDKFIHINKEDMNIEDKYLGKYLTDCFNKLSKYINFNFNQEIILQIENSFIKLKVNQNNISLLLPNNIDENIKFNIMKRYENLKDELLNNIYIDVNILESFYQNLDYPIIKQKIKKVTK